MDVAQAVIVAVVAVGLLGAWYVALWRGWRHASRDQTPVERRIVVSGVAALLLLPLALAMVRASDGAAMIAIAVAMAVVLPVLIVIGARDHRRRERRIREHHHGTSGRDD